MFLYITTFVLLLVMLYIVAYQEFFVDTPLLVLRTERSPLDIIVTSKHDTNMKPLENIDIEHHIIVNPKEKRCNDCNAIVINFFSLLKAKSLYKLLGVMPTENTLIFVKRLNNIKDETLYDVLKDNKKIIGYTSTDHEFLIRAVSIAMGVPQPNLRMMESPFSSNDIYCMFYFQELEHDKISFPRDINPYVLDLGMVDVDMLRSMIPYCEIKNKDFQKLIDNYMDRYSIKTCITIKNVVAGNEDFNEQKYAQVITLLRNHLNDSTQINFFSQFASKSTFIEGFVDDNLYINPSMNVHGFYEADKKLLTVFSETIDGIKLQQLDKIKLTNQQRAEENGEYTVKQVSSKYTILEKDPTETTKDDLNKYVCVGDPDKRTKQHCESVKKNVWDRPCVRNDECPFYQRNKNYPNYRGGCIDGLCEMPSGVKRKGFRYYDENTPPLCYSCPLNNPYCCKSQTKPDYVFSLDSFERQNSMGDRTWFWVPA